MGAIYRVKVLNHEGGPLSPLLSNIVLDELDKELEKRGHKFVRYADDCNIYVRTEKAGHRVLNSITRFIEDKLSLKVNQTKSAVDKERLYFNSERWNAGLSGIKLKKNFLTAHNVTNQ